MRRNATASTEETRSRMVRMGAGRVINTGTDLTLIAKASKKPRALYESSSFKTTSVKAIEGTSGDYVSLPPVRGP